MNKKTQQIILLLSFCSFIIGGMLLINSDYAFQLHLEHFSLKKNQHLNFQNSITENCTDNNIYSHELNDRVHQYLEESYLNGIKSNLKFAYQIDTFVKSGLLLPLTNSNTFIIDSLKYSYPFLTPHATNLLHEIGQKFQQKLHNTNLEGTQLVVTSLLRTSTSIKRLRRRNRNAIRYSSHLHGTTFDITYSSFSHNFTLSNAEKETLKEILAKTLQDLRNLEKCWVTFERRQSCFHIVSR